MKKVLKNPLSISQKHNKKETGREVILRKVDQGTEKAIKQYGEVFRRLAEYDRT